MLNVLNVQLYLISPTQVQGMVGNIPALHNATALKCYDEGCGFRHTLNN